MTLGQLAAFYALIGAGCTIALLGKRGPVSVLDAVLLALFWPLLGPYVLTTPGAAPARAGSPGVPGAQAASDEAAGDLLDALRRAGGAPLAGLLPDVGSGRRLARRMSMAEARVGEIDALLEKERFDEARALERQAELRESGDEKAAAMIDGRVQIIRRLRAMRDQWSSEIQTIGELLTQLEIQAEVVRLSGMGDGDTRELVEELVTRIQGLDDFLEMEL
jgi:hypothetical protein